MGLRLADESRLGDQAEDGRGTSSTLSKPGMCGKSAMSSRSSPQPGFVLHLRQRLFPAGACPSRWPAPRPPQKARKSRMPWPPSQRRSARQYSWAAILDHDHGAAIFLESISDLLEEECLFPSLLGRFVAVVLGRMIGDQDERRLPIQKRFKLVEDGSARIPLFARKDKGKAGIFQEHRLFPSVDRASCRRPSKADVAFPSTGRPMGNSSGIPSCHRSHPGRSRSPAKKCRNPAMSALSWPATSQMIVRSMAGRASILA